MEAEYPTANEWYKANRRELKKYRGEWITYTNPLLSLWTEKKAFVLRCLDFSHSQ
jgi:hypothetical protein